LWSLPLPTYSPLPHTPPGWFGGRRTLALLAHAAKDGSPPLLLAAFYGVLAQHTHIHSHTLPANVSSGIATGDDADQQHAWQAQLTAYKW